MDFFDDLFAEQPDATQQQLQLHPIQPCLAQLVPMQLQQQPWDLLEDMLGPLPVPQQRVVQPVHRTSMKGWGHWKDLSEEQKQLRGLKLREGRARKRAQRLSAAIDVTIKDGMDSIAAHSDVRMQYVGMKKHIVGDAMQIVIGTMKLFTHRGRAVSMTPQQMLKIAYSEGRSYAKAAIAKASRKTVKRVEELVAHVSLRLQSILLTRMTGPLRMAPPDWSVFHLMWDETGERLVVDILGNMTPIGTLCRPPRAIHESHARRVQHLASLGHTIYVCLGVCFRRMHALYIHCTSAAIVQNRRRSFVGRIS